jgi:hypothetical protein
MKMMTKRFGRALLAGAIGYGAVACSSEGASSAVGGQDGGSGGQNGGPGAGGGPAGTGGQASTPSGTGVSIDGNVLRVTVVARDVPPGDDQHVCVVLPLPNEEPVWVRRMVGILEGGSHHLIVDRQPGATPQLEPRACAPTPGSDASRLMIAQQAEAVVELPEGVAFSIAAGQPLFLQLHYFNSSDEVRDIRGHVDLEMLDPEGPVPTEARSMFTGKIGFTLPAKSISSIVSYVKPTPTEGTRHVFAVTSHTHRLGIHAEIEHVTSETAPAVAPLHVSDSWDEPPLTMLSPPLPFTGTEGLRLTCQYENTLDRAVNFGTRATDEMCFMWVYYFDR